MNPASDKTLPPSDAADSATLAPGEAPVPTGTGRQAIPVMPSPFR